MVAVGFILASSPVIFRDNAEAFSWAIGGFAIIALITSRGRASLSASLLLFVLWSTLSALWTYDVTGSAEEVSSLIASVVAGFALATLGARVVGQGLLLGAVIAASISLAVGVFLPRWGRSVEFDGAYVGIYAHRNFLASLAVVGLALAVAFLVTSKTRRQRIRYTLAAAIFAITGILTLSGSAIAISVVVVLGGVALSTMRAVGPLGRMALVPVMVVGVGSFAVVGLPRVADYLAASIGRDLTFTGRTNIWSIILEFSADRPSLGYGWGGVWRGAVGDEIRQLFGYDTAKSAHNAFLDALLQVGWIGLILLIIALVAIIVRSFRMALASPEYVWTALVLLALLVNSASESQATRPMGTFLLAIVSGVLIFETRRKRHQRPTHEQGLASPGNVNKTNVAGSSSSGMIYVSDNLLEGLRSRDVDQDAWPSRGPVVSRVETGEL